MRIGATPIGALLEQANVFQGNQTFLNASVQSLNLTTGERRIQMTERTDPAAPPANTVYIYCRDNGAGKTQVVARFATGPIRVLAIQA
jgi:hypothetical protein